MRGWLAQQWALSADEFALFHGSWAIPPPSPCSVASGSAGEKFWFLAVSQGPVCTVRDTQEKVVSPAAGQESGAQQLNSSTAAVWDCPAVTPAPPPSAPTAASGPSLSAGVYFFSPGIGAGLCTNGFAGCMCSALFSLACLGTRSLPQARQPECPR